MLILFIVAWFNKGIYFYNNFDSNSNSYFWPLNLIPISSIRIISVREDEKQKKNDQVWAIYSFSKFNYE